MGGIGITKVRRVSTWWSAKRRFDSETRRGRSVNPNAVEGGKDRLVNRVGKCVFGRTCRNVIHPGCESGGEIRGPINDVDSVGGAAPMKNETLRISRRPADLEHGSRRSGIGSGYPLRIVAAAI